MSPLPAASAPSSRSSAAPTPRTSCAATIDAVDMNGIVFVTVLPVGVVTRIFAGLSCPSAAFLIRPPPGAPLGEEAAPAVANTTAERAAETAAIPSERFTPLPFLWFRSSFGPVPRPNPRHDSHRSIEKIQVTAALSATREHFWHPECMRKLIVALGFALALAAPATAGTATPTLRLPALHPLVVDAAGFRSAERIRVVLVSPSGSIQRTAVATRTGT